MVDKITLGSIASFQNDTSAVTQYNANNALITTALNNTLSRDGTSPNQMSTSLDMNSNAIINSSFFTGIKLVSVNLNSIADTVVSIPSGLTNYRVQGVFVYKASVSLTTAQVALYTLPSAGGIAVCPISSLNSVTSTSANTLANDIGLAFASPQSPWLTTSTLYFRCTTPQGVAATANVTLVLFNL